MKTSTETSLTYSARDLEDIAEFFRDLASRQRQAGHKAAPAKRADCLARALTWDDAANILSNTVLEQRLFD